MTVTAQLPLPVVPGASVSVGRAAALAHDADGGRVFINGQLCFAWDAGDEGGRRLAAVQLVRVKAARQYEVAAAFGVNTFTLYRWEHVVAESGAAGLAPVRKGPKRASKLTGEVVADIVARRRSGQPVVSIGEAVGVSASSVALVLARARRGDTRGARTGFGPCGGGEADDGSAGGAGVDGGQSAGGCGQDGLWEEPATEPGGATRGSQGASTAEADDVSAGADDVDAAESSVAAPDLDEGAAVVSATDADAVVLPVLPQRDDRDAERALARTGLLDHARPVHVPAGRVPLAGLLLAVPALASTGLLECAHAVYGQVPNGFYGLDTVLLDAALRALIGEPRAEGAARVNPTDLGRVLGLDRAPEVKTVRRKISLLAAQGLASQLQQAMARRHIADHRDDTSILYVDGHVRVYQGTRKVQNTHVSRLRFPAPATVETWMHDAGGAPVWMVMAEPGASLASEIRRLLPEVRILVGDGRRILVCFDRGGWSPALFKDMIAAGFDVLTWRKRPAPDLDKALFAEHHIIDENGTSHRWLLAESAVTLPLDADKPEAGTVSLRQISKLNPATGKQAHILCSRDGLTPETVAYRMASRWREENHFRFSRAHFALDAHDCYASSDDNGDRQVPNPAKKPAQQTVAAARGRLRTTQQIRDQQMLALRTPATGQSITITNAMHNVITAPTRDARAGLDDAAAANRATPSRLPLSQVRPGQQVLDTETKLLTHAIRMAAYNTQTALARTIKIATGYSRAADEAHTLISTALKGSGDIDPRPDVINVRLDPLGTPRATAAIAQLCDVLNDTETIFPGTNQKLHYTIKPH